MPSNTCCARASAALLAAAALLAGCGSGERQGDLALGPSGADPETAGLLPDHDAAAQPREPRSEQDVQAMIEQQLEALRALRAQEAASPEPPAQPEPTTPSVHIARDEPEAAPAKQAEPEPNQPVETPEARVARLAEQLAAELSGIVSAGDDSGGSLVALLALESVRPGTGDEAIAAAGLSPDQADRLTILRDLLQDLTADERLTGPDAFARALAAAADRADQARSLRISHAALCRRVSGFGQYDPIESAVFVAGSRKRGILYVELEGFREDQSTGKGYEVAVSQEIQLFHDADGLLAWRQPPQVTRYTSRSNVRDYFVTNVIELPSTLTVGSYRLKVVMRDLHGRGVDEVTLPIDIVADARLARGDLGG